jgi:methyl coenzyme M reductase subunit C
MDTSEVVLVCVRHYKPNQLIPSLRYKARISRLNDVNRPTLLKCHTAVDHQPFAGVTIKVQVHTDLAAAS